jgi:hypothetical protein
MISGDVLKYRSGFFIEKHYENCLDISTKIPLTLPFRPDRRRRKIGNCQIESALLQLNFLFLSIK